MYAQIYTEERVETMLVNGESLRKAMGQVREVVGEEMEYWPMVEFAEEVQQEGIRRSIEEDDDEFYEYLECVDELEVGSGDERRDL